jgi:hypothetical protein
MWVILRDGVGVGGCGVGGTSIRIHVTVFFQHEVAQRGFAQHAVISPPNSAFQEEPLYL